MPQSQQTAEARCLCGAAHLTFLRPRPVLHVHCCCTDCRDARAAFADLGGPPLTHDPAFVFYFENDLARPDPRTLARLFAVKLRENGRTTRVVTRCCHAVLALDHPYYERNVLCVHGDACALTAPPLAPLCRIFSRDWDAAYGGEMPPATASLTESDETWAAFAAIVKRPVPPARGITLQDLLAMLPPPEILQLDRPGGPVPQAS